MDNYLDAKIVIDMGSGVLFTIVPENKNMDTVQDVKNWVQHALNEAPEVFKEFGDYQVYIRRVYPDMEGEWRLLQRN